MFYVYALVDPINRIPFYIGKGKGRRAYAHLTGRANYNNKKLNYINNIRLLGHEPEVWFLKQNLNNEESLELERAIINIAENFVSLTNSMTYPADRTGQKLSEEHKRVLREKNKGKRLSEGHKRKIALTKAQKAVYNFDKQYTPSKACENPNAKAVIVQGRVFGCMLDAATYFGVTPTVFRKRYSYNFSKS